MVWRLKNMPERLNSNRKVSGGVLHLIQHHKTRGILGSMRYKHYGRKKEHAHVTKSEKHVSPESHQTDPEVGKGAMKPGKPSTRRKVLEELGDILSGHKKQKTK